MECRSDGLEEWVSLEWVIEELVAAKAVGE